MSGQFHVAILGDGIAGASAAAMLAQALDPRRFRLSLVALDGPDDSLGPFGPVEILDPAARRAALSIGGNEELLAGASFSLGTAYAGWADAGAWFAPFGEIGAPLDTVAFTQLAACARAEGRRVRLSDYSLATLAAQLGRFARPSDDTRSVLSTFEYGYQVETEVYAAALRQAARDRGVAIGPAPFAGAELGAAGDVERLQLANGARIEADLFLDCSGSRALLIGGALGVPFESWARWLPCDRVVARGSVDQAPPAPYALVAAHPAGWRRTAPAVNRVGEGLAFASAFLSDEAAMAELEAGAVGVPAEHARIVAYGSGRRRSLWHRNCIALGAAAAIVEPVQPTSLRLLHEALGRLVHLFPSDGTAAPERAEFNRRGSDELDRLRDFVIARYRTNGRRGEPFWDEMRATPLPEPLQRKFEIFASRGRVPLFEGDIYEEQEWASLFDHHGLRQRRHDPLAAAIPADRIDRHLSRLREVMLDAAASLPSHADYLRMDALGTAQ